MWVLWLDELRARKNECYGIGRYHVYLTDDAKMDRGLIAAAWANSQQQPLGAVPLRLEVYWYRSPDDETGDADHTLPVIDHLTRAGAWPDDCWLEHVSLVRGTADTAEEAGILVTAWEI
jgi:hypothetical protein